MRKWILDRLYTIVKNTNNFKVGYKGVAPPITAVNQYPAFAVVFDKENRERKNISSCVFQSELRLSIIIYNQGRNGVFEDIMSDLIESVEDAINKDDELQTKLIDIYVDKIVQDGGLIHPKALAELQVSAFYRR